MEPSDRAPLLRSLEQREVALVRALLDDPALLEARGETAIRTAISLARLHHLTGPKGEVDVEATVEPLRAEVLKLLEIAGLKDREAKVDGEKLRPIAQILRDQALRTQEQLYTRFADQLPREVIDREVRHKALVVAAGGGGASGYIYLGAFKLLEECGLRPALIAGTSMGAILGLFRARFARYDTGDILNVMRGLSWGKLFQLLSMESRYGLPAALRLYLRASVGKYFMREDGQMLRLADLNIPLVACVSGIRKGVLPRPLEFYENLLGDVLRAPTPFRIGRKIPQIISVLMELVQISERLEKVFIGMDEGTEQFDAIDAVGFSAALPGVIHYDIVRRDDRMHEQMFALFTRYDLYRLADGSVTDNVPADAAWEAVQRGMAKTRNAFILAMDCFAPKLTTPLWLPMQTLVMSQVQRSCEYAHLYKAFKNPPSPLDLVPSVATTLKAVERGKFELGQDMPFISRMLQPLPPLETAAEKPAA